MKSGLILKKEKNLQANDSDELGDIYTLTAMKPDTRLFVSHHDGGRTTEDAIALFRDVEQRRSIHSPIPVFTSDNWDAFEEGLVNIYGYLENPPYKGTGRRPLPILVPYPDLKYAQVCKRKKYGQVIEVVPRVIFGDPDEVMKALDADSGGKCQRRSKIVQLWRNKTVHLQIRLLLEPITFHTSLEKFLGISPCRFRSFSL